MDFEAIVMYYLAAEGLFLSPQFSIRNGAGEWSCPDFVALDFPKHQVQVVEVTSAHDVSGLVKKIKDRDKQWFQRLRPQLVQRGAIDDSWRFILRAFVRKDRVEVVQSKFRDAQDVIIESIEDIAFPWKWPWDQWSKTE